MAITALGAITVGKQAFQAASWLSTVVFVRDTGARMPAPPLWDGAAVLAMILLVWCVWREMPGRSHAPAPAQAGPTKCLSEVLKDAPQLLVQYSGGQQETLRFINDGPGAISNVTVGPLAWKEERKIWLISGVGTIAGHGQEARTVQLTEDEHSNTRLASFIREK